MHDKNGNQLREGDRVRLYHNGDFAICKIIYSPEWAMFCLQWPAGYKNKWPMNPDRYEKNNLSESAARLILLLDHFS